MSTSTEDRTLYDKHAESWWNAEDRFFRSLRSVKLFHQTLLQEELGGDVRNLRIVDLGCGGGLFSLPLSENGAVVVGVDVSLPSLRAGREEALRNKQSVGFVRADLSQSPLQTGCADVVLMSDVIEHVDDPASAIREASRLLAHGGLLFVNTFDRTWASGFVVVTLAEGVGLVPKGTHDSRMFVRPSELEQMARDSALLPTRIQHESLAFWRTLRSWTVHLKRSNAGFGYTAFFRKEAL